MSTKKNISFYEICKEILADANKDFDETQFENYYKEQKKHFKEILQSLGVNPDSLKKEDKNNFTIPIKQKEIVKDWLENYTTKSFKKLRKSRFFEMNHNDLKDIIRQTNDLMERLPEYQKLTELSRMYFATRYIVRDAIEEVQSTALTQVISDLEEMKLYFTESHFLNDSDKAQLLRFYSQLIQETSQKWRAIVSIFEDIRQAEIVEESSKELDTFYDTDDSLEDINDSPLDISPPYIILWEAVRSYYEEEFDKKNRTPIYRKELDNIGSIIDQLKKNK
ncbi:hypothetical protein [Neobacillus mesonae]|uniref:hypothetical protein n=1 Tax=Neobacillus mesonae TaxID=1193713 RepID=UPI0025742EDA|nr:hypothetical protein [Neobacillus mesonae]